MNEEFFEALRQRAYNKFKGASGPPYSDGYLFGVGATLEALGEMFEEEEEEIRQKYAQALEGVLEEGDLADL